MKKTYKIYNEENRNCLFRVGKTLKEARFTPTYTTDNGIMQKAIEDTHAFKVGEIQLVTPSMKWKKIELARGFPSAAQVRKILSSFPVVLRYDIEGCIGYQVFTASDDRYRVEGEIERGYYYTHYMHINEP